MKRKLRLVWFTSISLFLLFQIPARAQDPQFSQFYANPLYLNPAFAGSNGCPRVCLNYRNQWPALTGTFVTTSASFDRFICSLHGGVGFLVTNDKAGEGTIVTTNYSALYAQQIQITRTFAINGGFQFTYMEKKLDWSKLTFGDMISATNGFIIPTQETPGRNVARNVDISAGILGFSTRMFVGFAVHHLTEPDEYLKGGPSKLPKRFTGHAGTVIPIGGRFSETSISPNIIYQQQQDFRELNLGFYVKRYSFVGGFWYRNSDAFIVLIGLETNNFKVGYSYDITVSKLTNSTAGSHELSMGMKFACKKCRKIYRTNICPSF